VTTGARWARAGAGQRAKSARARARRYKQALTRPGAMTATLNYYRSWVDRETRAPGARYLECKRRLRAGLRMPVLMVYAANDSALGPELVNVRPRSDDGSGCGRDCIGHPVLSVLLSPCAKRSASFALPATLCTQRLVETN
jgi:hypothetical protein